MQDKFIDLHPDSEQWGHQYITIQKDERLHYIRCGEGKPILLLHGWPGFWYDWRRVIPVLSKEADVIAPDFLGFGNSDKPDKPPKEAYTPEAQAKRMTRIAEILGLDKIILVGYDIGARTAQTIVKQMPNRISGLVLCNPPYPGIGDRRFQSDAQREFWYQHFHNIQNCGEIIGLNRQSTQLYLEHFYNHWVGNKDAVRMKEFQGIVDVYSRYKGLERSIAWYRSGAGTGLTSVLHDKEDIRLTKVYHPTVILWGEKDPIFPLDWSDRLGEFFINHEFHLLKGIGHFVPFESPEDIIKSVRNLRSNDSGGPRCHAT